MHRQDDSAARSAPKLGLRDVATGQVISIRDGLPVGRAFTEIPVGDHLSVSRRHGEFRIAAGVVAFAQNDVLSPAKLNGTDIPPGGAVVLRAGDRLRFGDKEFEIVVVGTENRPPVPEFQPQLAPYHAPVEAPPRARGGALVGLAGVALGAYGAWRSISFVDLAPPPHSFRLYFAALACSLGSLAVAKALWTWTREREGVHPLGPALAFLAMTAGLQWASVEWVDATTGAFSRAQADGIVHACAGDSFRTGPCAELYETCGPRCRTYALPQLVDAIGFDRPSTPQPAPVAPAAPAVVPPPVAPEASAEAPASQPAAQRMEMPERAPAVARPTARAIPAPRPARLPSARLPAKPATRLPAKRTSLSDFPQPPSADPVSVPKASVGRKPARERVRSETRK